MKRTFLFAIALMLTFSLAAQVNIPEGYQLVWQKNFIDYALNNLPGATNSMKRLEKADFDATAAPKYSTKEGGRQFYHATTMGEVPADLTFWPNKEFSFYHYFNGAENTFIGLRFTRNDGDNMVGIDHLQEGDLIVIGCSNEPVLASKTTCVRKMLQSSAISQDFVYGKKHRTFSYTEFLYLCHKSGQQVFQFDLGWMLYDIRVYRK